ncbi:site-specific DNA-methyltransferase [Chloroflexota bacterium]
MNGDRERMLRDIQVAERRLHDRMANKLEVNHELDRTLVSFQANKSENGYRWYKYKEAFSASLVRYAFNKIGLTSGRILDPFAGSGTALFTASDLGIHSVGIELLPNSAQIIATRKQIRASDPYQLARAIRQFKDRQVWRTAGKHKAFSHLRITSGAFPGQSEIELSRYLYEVDALHELRPILIFAALCILESISYTRQDGQYLRWDDRSGRRAGKRPFSKGRILGFTEAICAKLEQIASDIYPVGALFVEDLPTTERGAVELLVGSCLDILPVLKQDSFDGLITSPPYCNRYDYTRTYALELAMLGVGEDRIRSLRQTMLSCTVENREKRDLSQRVGANLLREAFAAFESQELLGLILRYLDWCREERSINNTGIPRMVRNYFRELAIVIFECARVLKPGAPFIMVNDNVRYQGVQVPVDLILADLAQQAGFDIERIWVLPKGKGNSSQQMGAHGRETIRKCVYVWQLKDQRAKTLNRPLDAAQSSLPQTTTDRIEAQIGFQLPLPVR